MSYGPRRLAGSRVNARSAAVSARTVERRQAEPRARDTA